MISESKAGGALLERTARSAELDDATGMYYYGARYYDPRLSIFISVDPLAEQTFEPYSYVGNNPIRYVDPTGMSKEDGEGGGFFSRAWSAIKNTFNPSSTDEDMTILDEIVINVTRQTKEERIKEKQIATIKSHWKSQQIKDEWREMGIWDDNISYNNFAHAVGSQLSLTMSSARFNGLFNFFSKLKNVNSQANELFNFTKTTARHMDNPARAIPVQIMDDIIKAPISVTVDPQGSKAMMYYSQIIKNGKLYNTEILYEQSTNTILHFKYTQKAIGPLSKTK